MGTKLGQGKTAKKVKAKMLVCVACKEYRNPQLFINSREGEFICQLCITYLMNKARKLIY